MNTKTIFTTMLLIAGSLWSCTGTNSTNNREAAANAPTIDNTAARTSTTLPPTDSATAQAGQNSDSSLVSADNRLGRRPSIVALAQQRPELTTFMELLMAADMVTRLESPASYTVFAPTNEAFAALPAGTLEALKRPESQLELQQILQAHILPKRVTTDEMRDSMRLMTAYGEEVLVTRTGSTWQVGKASILQANLPASNGILHIINKVLVPPAE